MNQPRVLIQERIVRMTEILFADALELAQKRDALERRIDAEETAAARARQLGARLEPQIRRAQNRLVRARHAVARIEDEAGALESAELRELLRRRAAFERGVFQRGDQVLQEARRGRDASQLRFLLEGQWRSLRGVERTLAERLPPALAARLKQWLPTLHALRVQVFDLRQSQAKAEGTQRIALSSLEALLDERVRLDAAAFELADQLVSYDFDIREITVEVGGVTVYSATGRRSDYELLRSLEESLSLAEDALARLDRERKLAKNEFLHASRIASGAQRRLAATIENVAWGKFAIDLGFIIWDVGKATATGGPVGALTEGLKKGLEQLEKIATEDLGQGSVAPGSIEAQINALYGAQLKQVVSVEQVGKAALERVGKEALGREKNALNKRLGAVLVERFGKTLTALEGAEPFGRVPKPADLEKYFKAQRKLARMRNNLTKAATLKTGRGYTLRSLGAGVLKDALKTSAKAALVLREQNAWIDFFQKDLAARALYPAYNAARTMYWQAYDDYNRLLSEKTKLLERGLRFEAYGFAQQGLSAHFDLPAELRITLRIEAGGNRSRQPIQPLVVVGGTAATPTGRGTYRVTVGPDALHHNGHVLFEIR